MPIDCIAISLFCGCMCVRALIEFMTFSGICYGMQIIAKEFGGEIRKKDVREDGPTEIEVDPKCPLFE